MNQAEIIKRPSYKAKTMHNRLLPNIQNEAIGTELATLLKERIAKRETELVRAKDEVLNEQAERVASEKELIKLLEQLKYQQALSDFRKAEFEQDIAEKISRIKELDQSLSAQRQETEEIRKKLAESTRAYRTASEQANGARSELAETRAKLHDANLKYRAVNEQVALLKEQVSQTRAQAEKVRKDEQQRAEQLKQQVLQSKKALADANAQIERLRQQKLAAENQVAKTQATLSFQLGYLLLHGFKSFKAFSALPGQLFALWRESKQRKAKKKTEEPVIAPPKAPQMPGAPVPSVPTMVAPFAPRLATEPVPTLPAFSDFAASLKRLKVACIMDEFTFSSYRSECDLLQLSPQHWQRELDDFTPELLFIESAWRGKDDLWGDKVGHRSEELIGIVKWCRQRQVPTVFWNKEDPVHFDTFLNTAQMFDYVFTTDIDCIHRYKAALGHDRVFLLPFACQPATTNPIETYERKDAFCFAGAYYVRYPDRTRDLGNFIDALTQYRPVEIYDRNFGKDNPNYQFPPEYQPFIVGNLPFEQIDKAYKGYRYAINLNSIKQSQSMFARRVFDLLASNTITVSNFSRGVRLLFGDLVVTTDSGDEIVRRLEALGQDDATVRKFRLAGLRKVMQEHTYQDRLAYVAAKLQGGPAPNLLPHIAVTAHARSQEETDVLLESFSRQSYANKRLLLVVPGGLIPESVPTDGCVQVIPAGTIDNQRLGDLLPASGFVAGMVAEDYYGPNYLLDLALATRYSTAAVVGKSTHHAWSVDSGLSLVLEGQQYLMVGSAPARAALVRRDIVEAVPLHEWVNTLPTRQVEAPEVLAVDEFNYCKNGGGADFDADQVRAVNDLHGIDLGLGVEELIGRSENIAPQELARDEAPVFTGDQLAACFNPPGDKGYRLTVSGSAWEAESSLGDGDHEYLYAATDFRPADLGFGGSVRFHLDATPGLNIMLVMLFLDEQKQRIGHVVKTANKNHEAEIPAGTAWIRLGLRLFGGGFAQIKALVLGHRPLRPADVVGRAEHLLLTDHYPSYDDLYRNGFVHSRVAAYAERGTRVDIFRLRSGEGLSFHEFHDVDVITGSQEALHKLLSGGHHKSVLVHFLDEAMWEVLQHYVDRVKVFVWVHGAEIHPWHRRVFNLENEQQREAAKLLSEKRMAFWRGLLREMPENLKLIFVSSSFAEEVMEDLGFRLPGDRYAVIHNPIDTELFAYRAKPPEQRKKVLSIRPYVSRQYANDLSVKAILELAAKPWFKDLEFRILGDGRLFDETLEPLRQFDNVTIEKRFLPHAEISALHREYGVFLCPTRWDSQGVSRDEAMSSGLVPVTNAVAAVPEFVDETSGILAGKEDAEGLAAGIAQLYENPENFLAMSKAASDRVRAQSSAQHIIDSELALFGRPEGSSGTGGHGMDSPRESGAVGVGPLLISMAKEAEAEQHPRNRPARDVPRSFLSFDVEALPGRAESDHMDRLVWGRVDGGEYGIRRICEVLRQHGLKGNFLIDFSACLLYGDGEVRKVVDFLQAGGHEVHTHLHSECLVRGWGLNLIHPRLMGFDTLDYDLSRQMLDFGAWKFRQFTGRDPSVFRPGGFRFNRQTVRAAKDAGFTALSTFNLERHQERIFRDPSFSLMEPFQWDNGLIEIPMDISPEPLDFNYEIYLGAFDRVLNRKNHKVFNVTLHSWSLLRRNACGHHSQFSPEYEDRLHQICQHMKGAGSVCGYEDYLQKKPPAERIAPEKYAPAVEVAPLVNSEIAACPICGAAMAKKKISTDICLGCGSRARHRQLKEVLAKTGNPFDDKDVIACHANPMEKQAFLVGAKKLLNFDVRPVSYVDMQMDIQDMGAIADNSFDCFFALHVLNHVKDDVRALAEIHRVLRSDGVLVVTVPYRENEPTSACEDLTEHYGADALTQFGVGSYRRYGKKEFLGLLEGSFTVTEHVGFDPLTNTSAAVFVARKQRDPYSDDGTK